MDTRELEGNAIAAFAIHVLRGIGQVVFQNNPVSGLIILGALSTAVGFQAIVAE